MSEGGGMGRGMQRSRMLEDVCFWVVSSHIEMGR